MLPNHSCSFTSSHTVPSELFFLQSSPDGVTSWIQTSNNCHCLFRTCWHFSFLFPLALPPPLPRAQPSCAVHSPPQMPTLFTLHAWTLAASSRGIFCPFSFTCESHSASGIQLTRCPSSAAFLTAYSFLAGKKNTELAFPEALRVSAF